MPGGIDYLSQFANTLTTLTTANGDALTSLGMTLLSCVAFVMLANMVISMNTATWTIGLRPHPMHVGVVMHFMLRLGMCALLEHYWVNPLPGAGVGFNKLFSGFAQVIVQTLDQNSMASLTNLLTTAAQQTGTPSLTAPVEILCYLLVQILMGFSTGTLFLLNISSFLMYAVAALFGPVFIPLLLTNSFRGKFFHFVDVLLSFAMIRAVAAAFVFVWSGFLNTFIQQTFHGDYSIKSWVANLIPVLMVFCSFIVNLLFVPSITQAIFGGTAGLAERAGGAMFGVATQMGTGGQ